MQFQISEELLRKTFKENEKTALCKIKCQEYNGQPTFWKTIKTYFSDKTSNSNRITFESVLTNEKDIVKTMNNFFIKITEDLNLKPHKDSSLTDINEITTNFHNHMSIKGINGECCKEIINLNLKKSSVNGSIPATVLKECRMCVYRS